MHIRQARPDDLASWAEMRSMLWPDSAATHAGELEEYFAGSATDIVQAFVLCAQDDRPCGFIELNVRSYAEGSHAAQVPYLEAWFVQQAQRGKGYGRQLMARAEAWALEQGYSELASDTTPDNQASIEMHTALGFVETERLVCFLKKLQG